MTYRIYLRDASQRVTDKTVTENKSVALAAFSALIEQTKLDGQKLLAVLNCDGKPIAHHDFAADPADQAKHWRGRLDQIVWPV